ncbi:unnamed protein product [Chironomus riparius]|uniref:Uncharacterized protein n=1 Tax=Chironomus riparius TaxID=315576 RepID=A0A9N9S6J5_9DIPT|nr:unnamed protein product [Chironomus riparius]
MEKICIIFVLMQFAFLATADDCDKTKCPEIPKHYEEMGCEAVKDEHGCCIVSFKCLDIKTRDANKCYYKDDVYELRENLKESQLAGTCSGSCFCSEPRGGRPAEFVCAHIDCPEFFHDHDPSKKCIRQYDNKHCCAIKSVCDNETATLSTCEFEGSTFHEGQKMYPKDLCYSCFCTKDYNSSIPIEENPSCNRIDCGITLRNTGRLSEGCIPVYYKKETCCPIGWRCPGEKHQQPNANFKNLSKSEPTCKFGKMEFNIGDKLPSDDESCQECFCSVPPMLHCIEKC